ncbi:MAG TPA: transketolase C-terminal domain-containing protein [Terriglobales bacterium]|nr:transketolase C-terminal domain-containing protein [Terriglobales bacterium]
MAREMMYGEAMAVAIMEEMQRDPNVIFYGQNMAMTERDPMLKMFGRNRVRIAPISETAEIGIAVGAAVTGLRPIVELWMSEFMLVAMDQVINEAPRLRYMSGGQVKVPLVLKAGYGFAAGWAGQHSNCIYHTMMGIPGLKVVIPSNSADAKGLMAAAIRDDNPVVYLHPYMLMIDSCEVPEGEYVVPIGVAHVKREGSDITIVATGWMVKKSLAAAEMLAKEGISAEVVDPRSLAPLDVETIVNSVAKTGRLVLVDQAPRHSSAAAVIAAEVAQHGFEHLRAPIKMVTALDTSIPYSEPLENYVLPSEEKIVDAVKAVMAKQEVAA